MGEYLFLTRKNHAGFILCEPTFLNPLCNALFGLVAVLGRFFEELEPAGGQAGDGFGLGVFGCAVQFLSAIVFWHRRFASIFFSGRGLQRP